MCAPERKHLPVEARPFGAAPHNRPEDRETLEQRRVARLHRVADLHAVVDERHAVHRKRQSGGGERPAFAETRDGAPLVMIV